MSYDGGLDQCSQELGAHNFKVFDYRICTY